MPRRKQIGDMTFDEVQAEIARLRTLILAADTGKHERALARKQMLQARMHKGKLDLQQEREIGHV